MSDHAYTNRLINEKSPYLLQHAHNPVDWYPWGDEAFAKAKAENKPIFLSIGYSTCHWCHVMERESFEDAEVARLLNDAFVSIKVDREERPDIDNIYMQVTQMLTGSGGWPMTIVMTPDKKPFFAGTYFPKETRQGRIGMLDLVPRLREAWDTQHEKVVESAEQITAALKETASASSGGEIGESALGVAAGQLRDRYDDEYGGFGTQPKFPTPHTLLFLLRSWKRTGDARTLAMVENTLEHMRMGGIHDHVGLGFHRYSTDREWLVPHFEKMLYDQALLTMAYTEAAQATGKEAYRRTADDILTYVLRDMTSPAGGFYSAEDADSEGEEGKFYLWTEAELREVLSADDADVFMRVYNIEASGNFADEAAGRLTGRNIPHLKRSLAVNAKVLGVSEEALSQRLAAARQKLFDVREKRIHPYKDDKILTDWNGLMIAALAKAARAFDEPQYADAAERAAQFVLETLRRSDGRLLHRYRDGEAGLTATVDDYAFFIWGLLELYEATFDVAYLDTALGLNNDFITHFWDDEQGAFYFTADDGEQLLVRQKEIYDGAIPSGNSVAMLNQLRLGRMTGDSALEARAVKIPAAFSDQISRMPSVYTQLMLGVDFAAGPAYEVVIAGDPNAADTTAMLAALRTKFHPNTVVLLRPTTEPDSPIIRLAPFTKSMTSINNKATAYVCQRFQCELPTTDTGKMLELMN